MAMVYLGFSFLGLFFLFMPCMLVEPIARKGAFKGCAAFTGLLAWAFYLVAWVYYVAKLPSPNKSSSFDTFNETANGFNCPEDFSAFSFDCNFGPGFGCAVLVWCLLTLALPGLCVGARIK
mmetsp:Transcript_57852/g.132904  ORF Transcript_57852/g.132904 Transcript_57852/m.132904 type:complete len:121 (-) Transcript_57852:406-768(-)